MKTFKDFKSFILNEDYSRTTISKTDTVEFILQNCQQWFKEIYGKEIKNEKELSTIIIQKRFSLYRGIENDTKYSLVETAINKKLPEDVPLPIHNAIVKAMKELGIETHFSNSLICSNDRMSLRQYLETKVIEPYLVFPIDGYEYVYAEKFSKLYKMIRSTDDIFTLKDIFPNLVLFQKYLELNFKEEELEDRPIVEILHVIPNSQLETVFKVDEYNLQKKYKIKNTGIKNYIFGFKPPIEIMFRQKLFLTDWRPY